ncbi:MAG: type IV pilin protein [Gammaproteobacteria bacterium]|nr:type IV pilin protein [Gammaproteobacteria bacterium]
MFTEQLRKGKRAEAMRALAQIQLRQEAYRSNATSYGNLTGADVANGNILGSVAAVTAYNAGLSYYTVTVSGNTATAYVITATRKGDMANDSKCGDFTITYSAGTSTRGVTTGNVDYCWRRK